MSSIIFKTGIRARRKEKKKVFKKLICLFVILVLLLNFLSTKNNNYQSNYFNNEGNSLKEEKLEKNLDCLKVSQGAISLLQDPYTINFSKMWTFFQSNFKSPLTYDISLYVSESDNTGTVIDNTTYSLDNLLLYKSLVKEDYDESDTFQAYLDLKSTPLWYYYNTSQYGFIKSINGTTGEIIDVERHLIDNLMPIFLLLENIGNEIGSINIDGETPGDSIIQMFRLINSSEFWDSTNKGFYETNSSITGDKDIKSNLYAVLANFMIYRYQSALGNQEVSDDAYNLAKTTMEKLVNKAWDNTSKGFYYKSNSSWSPFSFPDPRNYKYLSVNALGILALLEYWIMNGMNPNSLYYKNATALFNRINRDSTVAGGNGGLWNINYKAYETYNAENWDPLVATPNSNKIDLEANALMMLACLRLFEVSGNFTYYNRTIKLFESLRKYFYNATIDAHKTSHGAVDNTNIKLHSNLRLCEAYLKAFEIYNNTTLETSLITAGGGIINQDILNLTSVYAFEKDISVYNPSDTKTIRYDNITGASITYIFRYPNNTIFNITKRTFSTNSTTLQFPITDSLPFDNGYIIDIYANWTYFGFAFTTKTFNVISGLTYLSISGLRELYQGEKTNISIQILSNYNYNLTLNVTMFGDGIFTVTSENITFINNNQTSIAFNITVKNDATPGKMNITFTFINGTVLYLKKEIEIEIRNALTYSNLIYSKKVVPGNSVKIFLELINALPNETQSLNLIFSGTYIYDINISIVLDENERRTELYLVYTTSVILISSIEIEMSISKGKTTFYTEILTVEIVPSLEVISIEFPEKVTQGTYAYFIIIIQNNQESTEEFSLLINGDKVDTEINELIPGENRIEQGVLPTWNPYEFGIKTYKIEIEDSSEEVVFKDYFEYEIELSAINLICFYMIPTIIPLGIILYYKNKEIKHKLLKR
ncbi:MAG: hypothetical protein ACFFDO_09250 [Candidatus Thorarchaeota archaeon]